MSNKRTKAQEVLAKALVGEISQDDLALAIKKISENKPEDVEDMPLWIEAIGCTHSSDHRKYIEKFLDYPQNPWAARRALNVLCHWGFTADYIKEIKAFLRGVNWDTANDVRLVAIPRAGEFLNEYEDKELLKLLLTLFENPGSIESMREIQYAWPLYQAIAYQAIATAMGKEYPDIPNSDDLERWIKKGRFDQLVTVIHKAHQRLQNNP